MLGPVGWNVISARKTDKAIKDGYLLYSVSPGIANAFKYALQFAWAPLLWVITWYRLKEKEI
jgi:hypothetical protein